MPCECDGQHDGFRNRWTGFDSLVRYLLRYEAANDWFSECAGFARDFAMVEDQVRFLAGTLHDAGARRHGNRLQPGRSGFDSHRRLFQCNFKQATDDADAPAAHRPHAARVRMWLARCVPSNGIESVWFHLGSSMAEHQATNLGVAGSSPVHRARLANPTRERLPRSPREADVRSVGCR
jgi:hypothetical protein